MSQISEQKIICKVPGHPVESQFSFKMVTATGPFAGFPILLSFSFSCRARPCANTVRKKGKEEEEGRQAGRPTGRGRRPIFPEFYLCSFGKSAINEIGRTRRNTRTDCEPREHAQGVMFASLLPFPAVVPKLPQFPSARL